MHTTFSRPKRSFIESIYFWASLSFLIWRILLVLLCASRIHDESKKPINIIRTIPQEHYHKEVYSREYTNFPISVVVCEWFIQSQPH